MKKLLTFLLIALLAFGVGWATQVTMTMSDYYSTSSSTSAGTITEGNVTIVFDKGNGSNDPMYYNSGTAVRFYASNTMSISVNNGTISSVEVTFNTQNYANYATAWSVNTGTWSVSNTSPIGTWSGSASSMTFTNGSNQVRIKEITIIYSSGSTPTQTCATPTFSPAEGSYTEAQNVTISCATSGATIHYTTDGTTPTANSPVYSSAINVSSTTTIKAIATATGYNNSDVATATYIIDSAEPFTLVTDASTLNAGDEIIFITTNSASTSAKAMSTTQNSNNRGQTSATVIGTTPPTVRATPTTQILKLVGSSDGWYFETVNGDNSGYLCAPSGGNYLRTISTQDNSAKATINIFTNGGNSIYFVQRQYYLRYNSSSSLFSCYSSNTTQGDVYIYRRAGTPKVETPTFSPDASVTYTSAQSVTISCATEGATIYYTTDGTDPTTSSAQYTGAINVNSTMTIKAIAVATGYDDSEVATATYNIDLSPSLTVNPSTLNINDSGTGNTFTVEGSNLGTDNVGLTQTGSYFTPTLSATTGTTYDGGTYWGFTPANGSVNGTVAMNYTGTDLSASETVTLGNNSGASATVTVNYRADLYIVGDFGNGWDFSTGTPMTYNATDNTYTTSVTVNAGNLILFARKYDTNDLWGTRLVFGPNSGGDWWVNGNNATGTIDLNDDDPIYFVNGGTYIITINASTGALTVSKQEIGADDFILVESDDEINTTSEYILVYTDANDAMSTSISSTSNPYFISTSEKFSRVEKVISLEEGHSVNILVLEDADDGKYYIKGGEYYIGTSGNNMARSATQVNSDAYKWSISIENNLAIITNASSGRYLAYNTSSPRFTTYASITSGSVQQYASLYKRGGVVVPAPQITPAGGTGNKRFESFDVTITAADENYTIYYTTDGSTPTVNSTEYTGPFELPYGSAPTTVKAIAVDGDGNVSRPTTVIYYWDRATVSISPASQRVTGDVDDVTITATPSDATVTYKVNGGAEQAYSAPFTVQVNEENRTVTVVAIARKGESVATDTVTYTFKSDKVYSIAEFLALENGDSAIFVNPVVVLFDYSQNSSGGQEYIWVKDRTGYTQFFIAPQFDADTIHDPQYSTYGQFVPKYENGDVIPGGFKVKKGYYETGQYYQGQCYATHSSFQEANDKALADPEQVTLSELLTNPAAYNDRYLYINKLQLSNISGLNFRIAADENGDGTAEVAGGSDVVGYNKYNSPAWKNKKGQTVGVTLPTDGAFYNVKFIFQKWSNGYEIMPIEFTEWHENKVRLEDLVEIGEQNEQYTIINPLIAAKVTWDDNHKKFAIFAKDDEMYANKRDPGSLKSYLIEYENDGFTNTVEQEDYDQSNWIEILIPDTINTTPITTKSVDQYDYNSTLGALQALYENKILAGGTINGTYVDVLNPTISMTMPPAWPTSGSTYTPNIFCTGNFLMSNIDADGATSGRTDEYGGQYFMMDAKPHEFCKVVWAYFEGTDDYFVAPAREGDDVNGLDFKGGFLTNMSLCEEWGVTSESHAQTLFTKSNDESFGNEEALYSFNAIVRKNDAYWQTSGGNGAPRRITPKVDGAREETPAYIVYPLSSGDNSEVVTAVKELNGNKMIESIRYYNLMGQESKSPFEGINIVVTRYTDGSSSTAKVLR